MGELCKCDEINVAALRARINTDTIGESDVVLDREQMNISEVVDEKFEMFGMAPPPVTKKVELSHIDNMDERKVVDTLLSEYVSAFSTHRYDVGSFKFFDAELDCKPGSTVIERERQIKPTVVKELKPS